MIRARDEIAWIRWESRLLVAGLAFVLALIGWAGFEAGRLRLDHGPEPAA